MAMKKILLSITLFAGVYFKAFSQELAQKDYVIITYEYRHKPNSEGTYTSFWIVPQDSIAQHKSTLFPLAISLNVYNKNDQIDCCRGKEIEPFSGAVKLPIEEFSSDDKNNESQIKTILRHHRKKLMTLTKKWESGWRETVSVFATPVSGKFCSSNLDEYGQRRFNYKGKVFLPYSSFTYLESFWESDKGKYLTHQDLLEGQYNRFEHE